jgi:hypothetical protein
MFCSKTDSHYYFFLVSQICCKYANCDTKLILFELLKPFYVRFIGFLLLSKNRVNDAEKRLTI